MLFSGGNIRLARKKGILNCLPPARFCCVRAYVWVLWEESASRKNLRVRKTPDKDSRVIFHAIEPDNWEKAM